MDALLGKAKRMCWYAHQRPAGMPVLARYATALPESAGSFPWVFSNPKKLALFADEARFTADAAIRGVA